MAMVSVDFNKEYALGELQKYLVTPETLEAYGVLTDGKWRLNDIGALGKLIVEAVKIVEKAALDVGAMNVGKDKKDAVVEFLDETIHFGGLFGKVVEMVDSKIFGILVDVFVNWFNASVGNDWLGKSVEI